MAGGKPGQPPKSGKPGAERWLVVPMFVITFLLLISAVLALLDIAKAFAKDRPLPAKGTNFTCTPIAVWDGDGPIWCKEGERIRLAGIAARELDNTCRPGHPCPAASGIAARDNLVKLLGGARGTVPSGHIIVAGPPLTCSSAGSDRYRRTLAACKLPSGIDLGRALIQADSALIW